MQDVYSKSFQTSYESVLERTSEKVIQNNLRQILHAGLQHLLEEGGESVTYLSLKEKGLISVMPYKGESYDPLVITNSTRSLSVTTKDGQTVVYRR